MKFCSQFWKQIQNQEIKSFRLLHNKEKELKAKKAKTEETHGVFSDVKRLAGLSWLQKVLYRYFILLISGSSNALIYSIGEEQN